MQEVRRSPAFGKGCKLLQFQLDPVPLEMRREEAHAPGRGQQWLGEVRAGGGLGNSENQQVVD